MAGMSTFTDPDLPNANNLHLTPKERAALGGSVNPRAVIEQHKEQTEQENNWLERAEFDRIRQENEQMRQQLGETSSALTEIRTSNAQLQGQMQAYQEQQRNAQQRAATDAQFQLSSDELEQHGEMLPVIEKIIGRTRADMERQFQQRLAEEKAQWQQAATAPLQKELDSVKQQTAAQKQRAESQFQSQLVDAVARLGFGDVNRLVALPEFQARYSQPTAPGVSQAWGDTLKAHIENQDLASAVSMLRQFKESVPRFAQRDDTEVPAGNSGSRAPLSAGDDKKLQEREQLLAIYQKRMEDANQGTLPAGWTRAHYRVEQQKLRDRIDAIAISSEG